MAIYVASLCTYSSIAEYELGQCIYTYYDVIIVKSDNYVGSYTYVITINKSAISKHPRGYHADIPGLKVGRMTWTIWVTWVTF